MSRYARIRNVTFFDGTVTDKPLRQWLDDQFGEDHVFVTYGSRDEATAPEDSPTVKQVVLEDGRLLRGNWETTWGTTNGAHHLVVERPPAA